MKLYAISLIFIFSACASSKDVRPQADNTNVCMIRTDDADGATHKCIKEANHYCSKHGDKEPRFITEGSKYTGTMSEKDYIESQRVSAVAKTVGAGMSGYGYRTGDSAYQGIGQMAGIGGYAIDSAIGKGYTVEMRFTCQ
jgi:hypothetical protein